MILERIHQGWREEARHERLRKRFLQWEEQLRQGNFWCQENVLLLLQTFFPIIHDYFGHRHSSQLGKEPLGGRDMPKESLPAPQMHLSPQSHQIKPLPWESLASVLNRTSIARDGVHPEWLLISSGLPYRKVPAFDLALLSRDREYQFFQSQLGLDEEIPIKELPWESVKSALQLASFHYLLSDWPAHLFTLLETVSFWLRSYDIQVPMSRAAWDVERMISPFRSLLAERVDSYDLLRQVLEKLHLWMYLWDIPASSRSWREMKQQNFG